MHSSILRRIWLNFMAQYSGVSLIRTPLIRMLHYPDDISGNKLYENLSNVIHLSGRCVYPDDFAANQSVWINEARLYFIRLFYNFPNSFFRISNFFGLSTTEETLKLVKMRICCIKIGIVLVLHSTQYEWKSLTAYCRPSADYDIITTSSA
jgi:hypothetical protein